MSNEDDLFKAAGLDESAMAVLAESTAKFITPMFKAFRKEGCTVLEAATLAVGFLSTRPAEGAEEVEDAGS